MVSEGSRRLAVPSGNDRHGLVAVTEPALAHLQRIKVFPFVIRTVPGFGQSAATLMTFVASSMAILGTVCGHGPFAARRPKRA